MNVSHTGHTIKKFDEELGTLRDLVLRMGGLVEEQLRRAVEALERGDAALAREVIVGDREIDRIELTADEEIAHLLARRAPLGIDLRTVLTLSKTVNDLERVGDEAKKVARTARDLAERDGVPGRDVLLPGVSGLAQIALEMLRGALDALVRLDLEQAERVRKADDRVDDAFRGCIRQATEMMSATPEGVETGILMLFAAKGLERIGDHAKNVALYVFYLVEGQDLRHPKVQRGE
ncbi:MAG: phosphate transport system regulatory protein PhoU [Lysobacteraceae bacterium]|nr:MAG: phosphate transport system regulatory protein PhoU [Xanthomonadaceae bacterium]